MREEDEPIFTPQDFIRYMAEVKGLPINAIRIPKHFIITYQKGLYEYAKSLIDGKAVDWWIYGETHLSAWGSLTTWM